MKPKKSIQASLKILLLLEEFSKLEIREAIKMIESDFGKNDPLMLFLQQFSKANRKQTSKKSSTASKKPFCSKVISELEKTNKEKYLLLSKVDKLIREGKVLKKLTDIKRVASQVSKDFPVVKSRKDAIPKFMSLLAKMSTSETAKIVESIFQNQNIGESEYQELATFLIGNDKNE